MRYDSVAFDIAHTWDGEVARPDEIVSVRLTAVDAGWLLTVEAPFHDDPPPSGVPGPTDGLWDYEVVELFVVGEGGRYVEIELGPRGHHLVLSLRRVRDVEAKGLPLEYTTAIDGARWRGVAKVPTSLVPPGPHRANAYAIHGPLHARRYLCSTPLPGPKPDFHQPVRFPRVTLP